MLSQASFAPGAGEAPTSQVLVRSGEAMAFLGASVTEAGWAHPTGYLRLVAKALAQNGVEIVPIAAGVGGNTSRDMLARLERDILSRQPHWMTLDAGRNDVWHGSVDFAEYMENMTAIVDRARAAHIRVVLQTITPIGEEQDNEFNPRLAYFNDFLRYLAAHKRCPLADLNALFVDALKDKKGTGDTFTVDGVHMNERGDRLMALGLLRALGMSGEQIARAIPAAEAAA